MVFFNPVTPSWITTIGISKSLEVWFLIVWSSLNLFLVHQPAAKNSMQLQSTHTPIYSNSSQIRAWNPVECLRWRFFAETVNVFGPLAVFAEELRQWYLTEFLMRLCLRRFPLMRLHKPILNSPCLLILLIYTKRKNSKMKSWTDPTSSFPLRRTHPLDR